MRIAIAGATGLVGRPLTEAARGAGHDVVEISRSQGVDLITGAGLDLTGVEAVIDVTNAPAQEEEPATAYFVAVAEHLGRAATSAGVTRTVLLSIIGLDRTADEGGYYAAKLAHERATLEHAPGACLLRAAQFHDFAGQMLSWRREGDRVEIPDQPIQPVAIAEVVRVLLDLAVDPNPRPVVELAGPKREQLPDLVRQVDPGVTVVPLPVSDTLREGAPLPGPDAIIAGPDFGTWIARSRR